MTIPLVISVLLACFTMAGCRSLRIDDTMSARRPQRFPDATASSLPRWRGFNLLNKVNIDWNGNLPFREADFRLIAALGFNFVRLPLDYRAWTPTNDWTRFDESVLREIDQAVAWGAAYGVHVCLNLHRAPGYTVAQPPETTDLWSDSEAQRVCAMHWAEFARRYKGILNSRLSFNLFNEPPDLDPAVYAQAVGVVLRAIREQDPARLVIADGLKFARVPCEALIPLGIAQATRGYQPVTVSHYRAPWVHGADTMPTPVWPMPLGTSYLFGPQSVRPSEPISIIGRFPSLTQLRVKVGVVSARSRLLVKADGRTVLDETWVCDGTTGSWAVVRLQQEWGIYQNSLQQNRFADIPAGTRHVEFRNAEGDWMSLDEIAFRSSTAPGTGECVLALPAEWDGVNKAIRFDARNTAIPFQTTKQYDRSWLRDSQVAPWQRLKRSNVGVMVGEFGAYNHTPHDVTLRWMEDCLSTWKCAGMGWALWNLHGSFGILDSGRADVDYEDFEGHKLDRKMLNLLQKY